LGIKRKKPECTTTLEHFDAFTNRVYCTGGSARALKWRGLTNAAIEGGSENMGFLRIDGIADLDNRKVWLRADEPTAAEMDGWGDILCGPGKSNRGVHHRNSEQPRERRTYTKERRN